MFKRRLTLDNNQKNKRNRQTELLMDLDKCIQIPSDDKLLIRKRIKQYQNEIVQLFQPFRKDKNYCELQIRLRKYVQIIKNQEKRNPGQFLKEKNTAETYRVYTQQSQNVSNKTSNKCSPQKEQIIHKVIDLDITELKRKIQKVHRYNLQITPTNEKQQNKINWNSKSNYKKSNQLRNSKQSMKKRQVSNKQNDKFAHNKTNFNKIINADYCQTVRISDIHQNKQSLKCKTNRLTLQSEPDEQLINSTHYQKGNVFETQNMCYSSSIKTLLSAKLKEQKDKQYKDQLYKNRGQFKSIIENTVLKKTLIHNQKQDSLNSFKGDYFPIFLKTDLKQKLNQQYEQKKHLQLNSNQTDSIEECPKFGQFYKRIKQIIDSKIE